ncbi:MAG: hypothetical protein R2749_32280 [Acidimicrobiales bacterium]
MIDAAERNGVHIPALLLPQPDAAGGHVRRMCLVEIDQGRGPALSPAA